MSAYMIILAEINDRDRFMAYASQASKLVEQFGGEYIVQRTKKSECLEGDWPKETKVVISKWPSFEAAKEFWHSHEYEKIKKLRLGNATVRVRLVEAILE